MNLRQFIRSSNQFARKLKASLGRLLFDHKVKNTFTSVKEDKIKKVIYLRDDRKIGDMVICTVGFKGCKNLIDGAEVAVITTDFAARIIKDNKNVDKIFIYKKKLFAIIKLGLQLRKLKCDLYINLREENTFETFLLLRLISPEFALGVNVEKFNLYDISIGPLANKHIVEWHREVFIALKLIDSNSHFDIKYHVSIPSNIEDKAKEYLNSLFQSKSGKVIIFNPFAAAKRRCFSATQAVDVANSLAEYRVIVIGHEDKLETFADDIEKPHNLFIVPHRLASECGIFLDFALVALADIVITPNTSILHIATAFEKPMYIVSLPELNANWVPTSATIFNMEHDFKEFDMQEIVKQIKNDFKIP